ncbi:MAG: hypothetical protein V3W52_17240 [Syntrophobacteria bacterium]
MQFKEFVDNVTKLLADRPELAEMDVVASGDDEGNDFRKVFYTPTVGEFDADDGEFTDEDEDDPDMDELTAINAICIN